MKIGHLDTRSMPGPLIVAELSGNHGGSLEHALRLVDAVAAAGAHALKLQTYTPEMLTLDSPHADFVVADESSPWFGERLFALYERASTPWEWHAPIFDRARELGMIAFSTGFGEAAIAFLETLDVAAHKIASFENNHLALIRAAAATGKPLIISTGLATSDEIMEAVATARAAGCRELMLLKCTSTYPASPADANLATLPELQRRFGCEVGISDHTLGIGPAIASVALGATLIEKHVTLDRADNDVDAAFSLEPAELAVLVRETRAAAEAIGSIHFGPTDAERASLRFRRSIYVTRDLEIGDVLTDTNVQVIRPGFGLPPRLLPELIGRVVRRAVKRGTPLSWDIVNDS